MMHRNKSDTSSPDSSNYRTKLGPLPPSLSQIPKGRCPLPMFTYIILGRWLFCYGKTMNFRLQKFFLRILLYDGIQFEIKAEQEGKIT